MGKDYVLVTFINGEERKTEKMERGATVILKDGKRVNVGVTPNDLLGPTLKVEEIPKKTIKSLLLRKTKENK